MMDVAIRNAYRTTASREKWTKEVHVDEAFDDLLLGRIPFSCSSNNSEYNPCADVWSNNSLWKRGLNFWFTPAWMLRYVMHIEQQPLVKSGQKKFM
jgi:hypothetical protein